MMKKSTLMRVALSLFVAMFFAFQGFAQVTTASISGLVADSKGEGLPGATVIAVHTLSGTKYGTVTNVAGRYTFPAVRVGGPFKVTVSFVGYKEQTKEGVTTNLGATTNLNFKMTDEGTALEEVKVTANRADIFGSDKTGASTTIGRQALSALPTIGSRSINDFTKYNPQGNGRSFGGQDSRLNNFTIDGSVFNNGFGLGSEAQAGGRTNSTAISLDAIEEVTVNIAPYDVRQSGFVGAGLNAVTRSGTNEVQGSVYHSFRNSSKNFVGTEAKGLPVAIGKFDEKIFGFRVGAPIIKNKLFLFLNGESQRRTQPAHAFVAKGSSTAGNATRVEKTDIDALSQFMQTKFGYETGAYEAYDDETTSDKFLARLDYNINDNNKFTVRYTHHDSQDYVNISNSASAGFGNRITANALSFKNSGYLIQDNTRSIVAELNSTFGGRAANNFIIGYDKQIEDRAYAGAVFPLVDILLNNQTYMSVGMDPFTPANKLNYGTFHITDNYTLFQGKHTITLGGNFERYKSNNMFFPASNGVWIYNSLADFYNSANGDNSVVANRFQYRYSALEGGAEPLQVLKVNKFDLYAQDDFQVNNNLKVSYGLRAGLVAFGNTALENSVISAQAYRFGSQTYNINTGNLPKPKILWEPRIGFNWDMKGDKTVQIRGGSGIFTGRPPYVFVSNQIGNNGILTGFIDAPNSKAYPFVKDASVYTPATPTLPSTFDIAATDANYRFPQVWKTNVAIDHKLPFGLVGSVDVLYNKFLNAAYYFNANLMPATRTFAGPDTRDRFAASGATAAAARINSNVSNAVVLDSKSIGENVSATFKLERPWTNGVYGMVAYTYSKTRDLMSAGSIASGSWTGARSVNGNNNLGLAYGDNDLPHRVVGALSYRKEYLKHTASQVSLGYVGGTGTSRYSYTIAGDMNGDGVAGNDLLYVPNSASELAFVNTTVAGVTYTPAQQAEAFDKFIAQDPYLSTRKGMYAERNGAILPWLSQFDLSFIQDFFINVKGKRNTFQLRADIQNFGNFLNSDWGIGQFVSNTSPLAFASVSAEGVPQYRLNTQTTRTLNADGTTTSKTSLLGNTFQYRSGATDVWNAQLTLRYIFN